MLELTLMTGLGHATPDSMKICTRVSDPEVVKDRRRCAVSAGAAQARSSRSPSVPAGGHCPEAEYAAVIGRQPRSARWQRKQLGFYRRFVRTYPELGSWFAQPLRERLGWQGPETQHQRSVPGEGFDVTAGWINFNVRQYLTHLALTGRLQLNWGWLLGICVLKPWLVADQIGLPLSTQAAGLKERLIALGHVRDEASFRVSWALARLVLHRGDPDLTGITADDVEEMRQAIKHAGQMPGIEQVIDSARLATVTSAWAPAPTAPGWPCSTAASPTGRLHVTQSCPARR